MSRNQSVLQQSAPQSSMPNRPLGSVQRWAERNPDGVIYIVGASAVGGVLIFGSALAATACLTGLISCASAIVLIKKLPDSFGDFPVIGSWLPDSWQDVSPRRLLLKHQLLADISVSLGVFILFGATVTGTLSAAIAGLLTSCALTLLERLEK